MRHRPVRGQYRTWCQLCSCGLSLEGGAWVRTDDGRVTCPGEYAIDDPWDIALD